MHECNTSVDRREFIKGTAYGLALPFLPSLARKAWADEKGDHARDPSGRAKRLVCVGTQLGFYKPEFFGSTKDAKLLKPLDDAGLGRDLTTFSGLDHKGPTGNGHSLVYTLLTGSVDRGVSLDQYVAPALGTDTRYESLQLCAGQSLFNWPLSFTEAGLPLPETTRPSVAYAQIFGAGSVEMERQVYLIDSGRSLLDELTDEAQSLSLRINAEDRRKLDEYFTSIRSVEQKLLRRRDWLDRSFAKPDPHFTLPEQEDINEMMLLLNEDLMWDLMALAIKNDSTRVITLNVPLTGNVILLDGELTGASYHVYSHHGNRPEKIAALIEIERKHIEGTARFLRQLKDTPDDDGRSLLDTTITLIGSAMGDASRHTRRSYPLMVCGGGFNHKRHLSCATPDVQESEVSNPDVRNEMACDLYVTILQQLGFEVDQFSTSQSNLNGVLT